MNHLNRSHILNAANGRWHSILTSNGISPSFLTGKHGPCPFCGGTDRWRWDNKNGSGSGICSQAVLGNGCRAVGDGLHLLGLIYGLDTRKQFKKILSILTQTLMLNQREL